MGKRIKRSGAIGLEKIGFWLAIAGFLLLLVALVFPLRYESILIIYLVFLILLFGSILASFSALFLKNRKSKNYSNHQRKRSRIFEIQTLVLLLTFFLMYFHPLPPWNNQKMHSMRRTACANNLKQLNLALKSFAADNNGYYPPLDDIKNNFIFEAQDLFPKYLTDSAIVACPADPESIASPISGCARSFAGGSEDEK